MRFFYTIEKDDVIKILIDCRATSWFNIFTSMYLILDIFFTILHLLVMGFNLLGWAWSKTRRAHLVLLVLTLTSWFVLGIWYGLGYCPLTDWHWAVKAKRGVTDLPNSFAKWLIDSVTGGDINAGLVDIIILVLLLLAIVAALYVNYIAPRLRNRKQLPISPQ